MLRVSSAEAALREWNRVTVNVLIAFGVQNAAGH